MNKTVLIITSHYPPNIGGVESHLQALVNALNKRSWSVIISTYQPLAYNKKAPSFERRDGVTIYRQSWFGFNIVHKLTPYPALEFIYLFPGLLFRTLQILLKRKNELWVIHAQGLVPTAVAIIVGKIFSKRVISSTHNLYFFPIGSLYSKVAKIIFSCSDKVLVATKGAKEELVQIGVPRSKIGIFKYWINLKIFKSTAKKIAKKKLGWKDFKVFFVGRLITTKGVNIMLDIIKDLDKNICLVIAGSGAMEGDVKESAKTYSKNFRFLGRVENVDLPLYYSGADILIVPSTVDEGWGFVVMEAVACGTPVIASNKGGLSDATSSSIGVLVKVNPDGFKKAIEYFYNHQDELAKLQRNCRKYAQKHFGESNVKEIIKHYAEED